MPGRQSGCDRRGDDDTIASTKVALSNARAALTKLEEKLRRKEDALGVDDTRQLKKMAKSKFLEYRLDARALKKRLRDLLRARKFERDRIQRTSRRHHADGEICPISCGWS